MLHNFQLRDNYSIEFAFSKFSGKDHFSGAEIDVGFEKFQIIPIIRCSHGKTVNGGCRKTNECRKFNGNYPFSFETQNVEITCQKAVFIDLTLRCPLKHRKICNRCTLKKAWYELTLIIQSVEDQKAIDMASGMSFYYFLLNIEY
jgi:hypothetical protein